MHCQTNSTGRYEEDYSVLDNVILFKRNLSLYGYSSLLLVSDRHASLLLCKN